MRDLVDRWLPWLVILVGFGVIGCNAPGPTDDPGREPRVAEHSAGLAGCRARCEELDLVMSQWSPDYPMPGRYVTCLCKDRP